MSTDIELGALLRRLRSDRGEPLRVVAAATDMDSTLLSRIERGERLPTARQLEALALHFGVPAEDLRPMGNAARMMRRWADPEEVLRAADVIEQRSGSSRPRRASMASWDAAREDAPRMDAPQMDAMRMPAAPASPAPPMPLRSAASPYWQDEHSGDRTDRLVALETAAAEGRSALYELERAARDGDSVIALRATELLRQLRDQLG